MKSYKYALLVFTILSFVMISNCTTDPTRSKISSLEKTVDSIVQPYIDSLRTAGMAIGVMEKDSIIFLKAYGYADLEFDIPLSVNSSFQIGSITKQFTAVAIMQLAEQGMVDLDKGIDQYISFKNRDHNPTLRELLSHTSGINAHEGFPEFRPLLMTETERDTILRLVEKASFDFEPGSAMIYSNTGYIILGLVVEKVTGQSYQEYIETNIFSKAGMTNSYYCNRTAIRKYRAHGYNFVNDGKYRAEEPYYYWTFSAGALCSTAEDLLKWNRALHEDSTILNKSSYVKLIENGQLENGIQLRYAKGLQRYRQGDREVIAHGGSGSGILAELRYFPKQRISVVTLENTYRRENWFDVANSVVDKLIPVTSNGNTYQGDLSIFQGTYEGNWKVKIENKDNNLFIEPEGAEKETLKYIGNNRWSFGENEYFFSKGPDGKEYLHIDMIYAMLNFTKKE